MTLHVRELEVSTPKATSPGATSRKLASQLNFDFHSRQLTAVIGPNGSGKSTLLRILAGLSPASRGAVYLNDRALHTLPSRQRAQSIAYLPQRSELAFELTVGQLVHLGRMPHQKLFSGTSSADEQAVAQALAQVGLAHAHARRLGELSGGEVQRVMLARMLATDSPYLLLDEPTAGLDVGHALPFLSLCRDLAARGKTVVVTLHELAFARRFADSVLCLGATPPGAWLAGPPASVLTVANLAPIYGVSPTDMQWLLANSPAPTDSFRL